LAIDKLDEAEDAISRAINLDPRNSTFQNLKLEISKRKKAVDTRSQETLTREAKKREADRALKTALKVFSP
jgi:hypothetical protein